MVWCEATHDEIGIHNHYFVQLVYVCVWYLLNFVGIPNTVQDSLLIPQTINRPNQYRYSCRPDPPGNSGPSLGALGFDVCCFGSVPRGVSNPGSIPAKEVANIGSTPPVCSRRAGSRKSNLFVGDQNISTSYWIRAGLDGASGTCDKGSRYGKTFLYPRLIHYANGEPMPCGEV